MREADFYEPFDGGPAVRCLLCPHLCEIGPEGVGACSHRRNLSGVLYAQSYGEATVIEERPVEWLPLYHYAPGARALLVGSLGESFAPQLAPPQRPVGMGEVGSSFFTVGEAIDMAAGRGVSVLGACGGEPFMWLELWAELCEAARREGVRTVALTNAFASEAAAARMAPLLDAVNVALIGTPAVYARRGLPFEPVRRTLQAFGAAGCHIELTLLVVGGEVLDEEGLEAIAELATAEVPVSAIHVSSPLDPETAAAIAPVHEAFEALSDRAPFVYLAPIYARASAVTTCMCGGLLVERSGAGVHIRTRPDGACPQCGAPSPLRGL